MEICENQEMAPMNVITVGLLVIFFYVFGLPEIFTKSDERISMKELLSASIVLARRGGDLVFKIRNGDTLPTAVKGKTKEGIDGYLFADLESHKAIFYGFAKAFPGLNVVSEEHEKQPVDFAKIADIDKHLAEVEANVKSDQSIPKKEITVWIDPLDAVQEYTEKIDRYGTNLLHFVTTMVCVAVNGQPTIGVIHKPFANDGKGETTWAWVAYGQSTNLLKVDEREKGYEEAHRIIVGRSHAGSVEPLAREALGNVKVTPAGGAGYRTLEVIKGQQDAYIHSTLNKKWDTCAGNAILSSLDGKMTTLEGKYIDYSSGDMPKIEGGLLATVYNHDVYLDKLAKKLLKE